MIEFAVLKIIWWMIIGIILVVYATTAGFDLGVTMIMPFLRNETDRRLALNTSAPVWDGNQTWLVFAGGGLFVVWPVVYSMAFSGLYAAILLILFAFFLRPPGYDYRSKIESMRWKRMWDLALFISAFFPVLAFGIATGNCVKGFNFQFDPVTMREYFGQNFWDLLSVYGVLSGLLSVSMVVMHGASYLMRRVEYCSLWVTARRVHWVFLVLSFMLFSVAGLLLFFEPGYILVHSPAHPTQYPLDNVVRVHTGAWMESFKQYPWKVMGPISVYFGLVISAWGNFRQAIHACFWGSVLAVGGIVVSSGMALFPFIMPSASHPAQSITVWNAVSTQYALSTMLYLGVPLLLLTAVYKLFAYRSVWGKKPRLSRDDVLRKTHEFY